MLEIGQLLTLGANIGVIAGIIFLVMEVRQNNRLLAAQARYSLRQYRNDLADSLMLPHVLEAAHKWAAGESLTPVERSAGLLAAIELLELWEWQYGEYADWNASAKRVACRRVASLVPWKGTTPGSGSRHF